MQLVDSGANLLLRGRPLRCLGKAPTAVRKITGVAGRLIFGRYYFTTGIVELAGERGSGVVDDVDGSRHIGVIV